MPMSVSNADLAAFHWMERFNQEHPVLCIGLPAVLHTGERRSFVAIPLIQSSCTCIGVGDDDTHPTKRLFPRALFCKLE